MEHSKEAVLSDPNFCNRKFIIGTYACPQAVGNHMHEFMNNFAGAFITNRTLLWRFCSRKPCQLDNEGDCNESLQRASWITSYDDIMSAWTGKGCTAEKELLSLIPQKFRYQTEEILVCCGIDKINHTFIDYGTHELKEFVALATTSETRLDEDYKAKAKLLFHSAGSDFGYGVLLKTSFRFQDSVISNNDQTIAAQLPFINADNIYFGLHLRHSNMADSNGEDYGEVPCLRQLLESYKKPHQICILLLASDRPKKLEFFRNSVGLSTNCTVVTTNHTYTLFVNRAEHGPFTGMQAMLDLELLSRSDYLIGSTYANNVHVGTASTYSLLAAGLRAINGRSTIAADPNDENKDNDNGGKSNHVPIHYLPHCRPFVNSKYEPSPVFTDKFKCGNNEITKIMLPYECPYWNKTSLDE